MKNMLPKFFGQALFLCLSITLSLIAAEFVLSVLARHNPKIAFLTEDRSNPENIEDFITFDQLQRKNYFLLKPGEYFGGFIANSKGFVTPEHSYKKKDSVFRIVLIGDSFGVGIVPYKKNFIRIVEERLLQEYSDTGKEVEVINLSIPGVGVKTYERLLALEGIKYDPDIVLITFYVGNDLENELYTKDGYLLSEHSVNTLSRGMPRLFILTKNIWTILSSYHQPTFSTQLDDQTLYTGMQPGALAEPYQDEHDDTKPTFTETKYQQLLSHKLMSYFSPDARVYKDNMTQIEDVFRKNAKHAQEHGFILGYIIIPDELQINDDLSKKSIAALPEATVIDLDLPQKKLQEVFPEASNVLDLLPIFRKQDNKELLYQPRDTHINVQGNKVTADAVYEFISRLTLDQAD